MQATQLWSHWQAFLRPCAEAFTPRGFQRFTDWLTGLALNVEEHTITQSLVALDRPQDWKALETFAEYGAWDQDALERAAAGLIDQAPERLWHGYRVWAGDDTKVHRASKHVWGTCTFHEYTARCPNRAGTVRAHNWVVLGALLPRPSQPALFLPHAGRLYFRQAQRPAGEPFRTKPALLVELLRAEAAHVPGRHLGVLDGAFALRSVVRPLTQPTAPRRAAGVTALGPSLGQAGVRFQQRPVQAVVDGAEQAAPGHVAARQHRRIALAWDDERQRQTPVRQARERALAGRLVQTPYVRWRSFPGLNVVSAADFAGAMGPRTPDANAQSITGRAGWPPCRYQSDHVDKALGPLICHGHRAPRRPPRHRGQPHRRQPPRPGPGPARGGPG